MFFIGYAIRYNNHFVIGSLVAAVFCPTATQDRSSVSVDVSCLMGYGNIFSEQRLFIST